MENRIEIEVTEFSIDVYVILGKYRFLPIHCDTWHDVIPLLNRASRMQVWISTGEFWDTSLP